MMENVTLELFKRKQNKKKKSLVHEYNSVIIQKSIEGSKYTAN